MSIYFNLLAWCVEVLGDVMGLLLRTYNFFMAMNLRIVCSSGLTPVIYLIGGRDFYNRASSFREKNMIQNLVSVILKREKRD